MKKSLLALAVLGTVAGAAQAASSVTLYGRVDIGYQKSPGNSLIQAGNGETRLGIKGQEDLGNGLSATFQMEGRFDLDTGAKSANRSFFDRESTVGLKGNFGHVRFGRSLSALENSLGFVNIGRRIADISPYASAARHSNGLFYSYTNGAFTVGGDITTKGGWNDGQGAIPAANDGTSGAKSAYGIYGKYSANGLTVGLGYQADRRQTAGAISKEFGLAASYTFAPVTVGVSYAQGKDDVATQTAKSRIYHAFIAGAITPNDTLAAVFHNDRRRLTIGSVTSTTSKMNAYGLEYVHALSKRTSVYADVARVKTTNAANVSTSGTHWDVAIRHNF